MLIDLRVTVDLEWQGMVLEWATISLRLLPIHFYTLRLPQIDVDFLHRCLEIFTTSDGMGLGGGARVLLTLFDEL